MPDHLEGLEEAVEAVHKQRAWRDAHHASGWTEEEALELDLQAAAPAIRKQERQRMQEAFLAELDKRGVLLSPAVGAAFDTAIRLDTLEGSDG